MNSAYMSIDAFVQYSGIGRTRVYLLLSSKSLRAIKVGKRTLIDRAAADAWLASMPIADIRCKQAA